MAIAIDSREPVSSSITMTAGVSATAPLWHRASTASIGKPRFGRHRHGKVFEEVEPDILLPADDGADGRFDLFPPDVADELASALASCGAERLDRPYRLIVRRTKETMNSLGRRLPDLSRRPLLNVKL